MKKLIYTAYFWLLFFVVTLLGLVLLPLFLIINVFFLRRTAVATVRWGIAIYGWTLVKIVPFLMPVKVESRIKDLPLPAIIVPNHTSAIDPYLFGALLIELVFVTTWPFKIPVYNFFMRLAKYIDANQGWEKIYEQSAATLDSGSSLVIWPEGHRSRDGRLGRFKNGAFAIAAGTGYPLLPVCIVGSRKFLPPGKSLVSPNPIKLVLLDPIYPDVDNERQEEIIILRNKVQEVIKKTLQENSELSIG